MSGKFYVVATPIGNLKDITLRAIDTLKEVDVILCEDTRVTAKLLDKYSVVTKLLSYHKHNEKQRTDEIINMLKQGQNIALVTDAGTPCVSDPGCIILDELYKHSFCPEIIPGVSAVTAFLSVLPRDSEEFTFIGFVPRKLSQQKDVFEKYSGNNLLFYESPNRLLETLQNILNLRGFEANVAVGRELTKIYEEIKIGTVEEIHNYFSTSTLKGEVVVMIYATNETKTDLKELKEKINKLKAKKISNKDISVILSELYGYNKNEVYSLAMKD